MRFRVVGANRQTNARMILEFEAESKAAAERKATQAGMSVTRVEDITDGYIAPAMEPAGEGAPARACGWKRVPSACVGAGRAGGGAVVLVAADCPLVSLAALRGSPLSLVANKGAQERQFVEDIAEVVQDLFGFRGAHEFHDFGLDLGHTVPLGAVLLEFDNAIARLGPSSRASRV